MTPVAATPVTFTIALYFMHIKFVNAGGRQGEKLSRSAEVSQDKNLYGEVLCYRGVVYYADGHFKQRYALRGAELS